MSTDATIDAMFELFPPEVLCHHTCLQLQVLFVILRDILHFSGITIDKRRGLYIPQAIVNKVYESDNSMRSTATSFIADFKLSASRQTTSGATTITDASTPTHTDSESFWRRVDNANKRFSEQERYSGILAESPNLQEVRKAYLTYCNQKDFPRADRVRLISAILKGPALNFWMEHINGNADYSELGSVFKALESQFDTPAHQKQIEALANAMTMEEIMKRKSCSRVAALGVLYHEVSRLNEQFPKVKRGAAFKTQTLMKIVERYEWSRTAEEEVMQDKLDYDSLYTKLSASIVIWENEIVRNGKSPNNESDLRSAMKVPNFIAFGEQYARASQRRLPFNNRIRPRNNIDNRNLVQRNQQIQTAKSKRNGPCFICGRTGHWRAECPYRDSSSMISAVRSRIKQFGGHPNQAAARILFELVDEEDSQHINTEDDENTFETLVQEHFDENQTEALEIEYNEDKGDDENEQDFQEADGQ